MKQLSIRDLRTTRLADESELRASVRWGRAEQDIYFRTAHAAFANVADPFVPAVLLPAMRRRFDVGVEAPVSNAMLAAAKRVQTVEAAWNSTWSIIDVAAAGEIRATAQRGSSGGVGLFFSGGVDSFYSLRQHRAEITHLIFVSGFDLPVHRADARELALSRLRKVAEAVDVELIEVETNLRGFSERLDFSWEDQHGAALSAVAHFLAPGFRRIYFPSGSALPFLHPHGSHPGLDPLWGSESLQIVHDGIEATRFDKIGAICDWDIALENLRVCWQVVEGRYNCCRCRKCLWTMAFLRAHGALERAKSFPEPLDLRVLGRQAADNSEQRYRMLAAIAALERRGDDDGLLHALRQALQRVSRRRSPWRRAIRRCKRLAYERLRRARRLLRKPR